MSFPPRSRSNKSFPKSYRSPPWTQHLKQPFRQTRIFKDRPEQHQTHPRILMLGDFQQRLVKIRIAPEPLRAIDQPQVELVFQCSNVRNQLGLKPFRIVDQISRMYFKELREQHPSRIRQVRPGPAFNLRQIGLTHGLARLLAERTDDLLLRHLAAEAPERALHFPEIPNFRAERHIAICDYRITICNSVNTPPFAECGT